MVAVTSAPAAVQQLAAARYSLSRTDNVELLLLDSKPVQELFRFSISASNSFLTLTSFGATIHIIMRLVVLYRKRSDHARSAYEFIEMMRRRYPDKKVIEMDLDTREGAAEASLYGIMRYPAIITTGDDGRILGSWEGLPLPMIDEVVGSILEVQPTTV